MNAEQFLALFQGDPILRQYIVDMAKAFAPSCQMTQEKLIEQAWCAVGRRQGDPDTASLMNVAFYAMYHEHMERVAQARRLPGWRRPYFRARRVVRKYILRARTPSPSDVVK